MCSIDSTKAAGKLQSPFPRPLPNALSTEVMPCQQPTGY